MPNPFTYPRLVQFSETDLAGIAHFANFFRWMEEAEHAYFRSVGLSVRTEYQEMEIGWPRVSTACEFFAPARFEDQLQIAVRIVKMGDKSISWEIEFSRAGTRLALGKATTVCCIWSNKGLQPIPIPPEIRLKLNPA
jgi:YbgC/YbaW family acyl-CoA thioester hydrolase